MVNCWFLIKFWRNEVRNPTIELQNPTIEVQNSTPELQNPTIEVLTSDLKLQMSDLKSSNGGSSNATGSKPRDVALNTEHSRSGLIIKCIFLLSINYSIIELSINNQIKLL